MATFKYKAHTEAGKSESGKMEAESREDLIRILRSDGKYCYDVRQLGAEALQNKPLKLKEISNFCRQLSSMLGAGVNMSRSLNTIYLSNVSKRMKSASLTLYESVLRGQPLSQSMQQMGKVFPELLIYMIETGEASGTLDDILENMADHYEQELYLKKKAVSALIYPIVLCIVSVAVVVYLLANVFPKFVDMYAGVDLPAPTRLLMSLSDGLKNNWAVLLGVLLALSMLFAYLMTKKSFRVRVSRSQLKLPVIGKLLRTILTSRFASTFAILYSSGIGVLKSVDILSRVMNNAYVEQELIGVQEGLRQGNMLSSSLDEIKIFDQMLVTTVAVGEESGMLDEMLRKTGSYFSRESETALARLVSLIEPIMIVVLGIIVGFIVIAAITPVFSMYEQIL